MAVPLFNSTITIRLRCLALLLASRWQISSPVNSPIFRRLSSRTVANSPLPLMRLLFTSTLYTVEKPNFFNFIFHFHSALTSKPSNVFRGVLSGNFSDLFSRYRVFSASNSHRYLVAHSALHWFSVLLLKTVLIHYVRNPVRLFLSTEWSCNKARKSRTVLLCVIRP